MVWLDHRYQILWIKEVQKTQQVFLKLCKMWNQTEEEKKWTLLVLFQKGIT